MEKSAEAYRTIGEVAEALKLPQHVLRFWETRFPQVKPLKRGGGRRFYRPEDVDLLRAIKALLYGDGYTIKGVQRLMRDQGPRAVANLAAQAAEGRARPTRAAAPVRSPPVEATGEAAEAVSDTVRAEPPSHEPDRDSRGPSRAAGDPFEASPRLRAVLYELVECERILAAASRT